MKEKKLIVWAALAVFAVGLLITVIIVGSTGKTPEGEITASTEYSKGKRATMDNRIFFMIISLLRYYDTPQLSA